MDVLLAMTEMEYETWAQPYLNTFLILELVYAQAFSEAKAIPSDWGDILVMFARWTGRDADDLARFSGHWYNICTGSNMSNQYGVMNKRSVLVTDMLRYAFTSQCLFDPDPTLPFDEACLDNIAPRRRFGYILDHCGGKLCEPTELRNKSVPFMINELVNYCMPLSGITDMARTANQMRYLRENDLEECMVARDFNTECDHSEERENELRRTRGGGNK